MTDESGTHNGLSKYVYFDLLKGKPILNIPLDELEKFNAQCLENIASNASSRMYVSMEPVPRLSRRSANDYRTPC